MTEFIKKKVILFDVDGTLVESGCIINNEMSITLNNLKKNGYEIGIVGGGKFDKILLQMDNKVIFQHYFSECGCVYHKIDENNNNNINKTDLINIYSKNIREHYLYDNINILIKKCLEFLSMVDYTISGHFIDLRNGIIYVSLIGLSANQDEREYFMKLDKNFNYRKILIKILEEKLDEMCCNNKIDVVEGGSVGIAIYPSEFDKVQVLDLFDKDMYDEIIYFGDKYNYGGNDYKILNDKRVIGHKTDSPEMTNELLKKYYLKLF
jgi:phosphomannomutase